MPRPALTDEQRKRVRRNIREAAAELYAQNGLGDVSVRAVAEHAGVSVGTVYSYFGSLSELLQSLWRQPVRKLVQQMTHIGQEISDPAERLRALLQAYVRFSGEEPQVFRSAMLFVRPESIPQPEQIALADDAFFTLFVQAIADGQRDDQFRQGDPAVLAQLVLSAVHGALALPINLHRLALIAGASAAEQAISAQLQWLLGEKGKRS
ncbi:MAG: TetR/AcrR family transcriptional regulator [Pseudomonadaceae bacterium]|nr:TetR/AcrR family transcriptional regulator [Pseudomonadaceae bacterium]